MYIKGGRFTTFFELQTLFKWQYIDLLYWKHQKKFQADCRSFEDFKIKLDPLIYKSIFLKFFLFKNRVIPQKKRTDKGTVRFIKKQMKNERVMPWKLCFFFVWFS